jgi:hypothetical protein
MNQDDLVTKEGLQLGAHESAPDVASTGERRERAPRAVRKLRTLLRGSSELLHLLSAQEREQHRDKLARTMRALLKKRLDGLPADLRARIEPTIDALPTEQDMLAAIDESLREVDEHSEKNYKKARDAKPRNADRDMWIIRLRDEEHRTFGEIALKLRGINPDWSKDGAPLPRDTIEKAYYRI